MIIQIKAGVRTELLREINPALPGIELEPAISSGLLAHGAVTSVAEIRSTEKPPGDLPIEGHARKIAFRSEQHAGARRCITREGELPAFAVSQPVVERIRGTPKAVGLAS